MTDIKFSQLPVLTGTLQSTDIPILLRPNGSGGYTVYQSNFLNVYNSIPPSTITATMLGASSVTNAKYADGSISASKYIAGSVTSTALSSGSVITAALIDNAVTTAKVLDGAITLSKLSSSVQALLTGGSSGINFTGDPTGATDNGAALYAAILANIDANTGVSLITMGKGNFLMGVTVTTTQMDTLIAAGLKEVIIQGQGYEATKLLQAHGTSCFDFDMQNRASASQTVTGNPTLRSWNTDGYSVLDTLQVTSGWSPLDYVNVQSLNHPPYDNSGRWVAETFQAKDVDGTYIWVDGRLEYRNQMNTQLTVRKLSQEVKFYFRRFSIYSNDPTDGTFTVSAATQANPGKITTSTAHNFQTGDTVTFFNVGGMTQLNTNTYTITVIDNFNFTIGVNTTGFTAFTSGGQAVQSTRSHACKFTAACNIEFREVYFDSPWEICMRFESCAHVRIIDCSVARGKNRPSANEYTYGIQAYAGTYDIEVNGLRVDNMRHGATTDGNSGAAKTLTNPYTTTLNSGTVSVTMSSHGQLLNDYVDITTPVTFNGIIFSGLYKITGITSSSIFTIATPATAISAVTNANPAAVTTATPHGLTTGQKVTISGVLGMTQLNGNNYTITVVDSTHYTLGVDSTAYGTYTGAGTAQNVASAAGTGGGSGNILSRNTVRNWTQYGGPTKVSWLNFNGMNGQGALCDTHEEGSGVVMKNIRADNNHSAYEASQFIGAPAQVRCKNVIVDGIVAPDGNNGINLKLPEHGIGNTIKVMNCFIGSLDYNSDGGKGIWITKDGSFANPTNPPTITLNNNTLERCGTSIQADIPCLIRGNGNNSLTPTLGHIQLFNGAVSRLANNYWDSNSAAIPDVVTQNRTIYGAQLLDTAECHLLGLVHLLGSDTAKDPAQLFSSADPAVVISSISKANPASVTTASVHGLTTGDDVIIFQNTATSIGMTQVKGKRYTVTVVDTLNFTLNSTDSTGYSTYTTTRGSMSKAINKAWSLTGYVEQDVFGIGQRTVIQTDREKVFLAKNLDASFPITMAQLPASPKLADRAFVTDDATGPQPVYWNGTNWKRGTGVTMA